MIDFIKEDIELMSVGMLFDFDGTVTITDVVDKLVETFSIDKPRALRLEDDWINGRIGSRECLTGQLSTVKIDEPTLRVFLSQIKIDPHFNKLAQFLRKANIPFAVASDGFDYFIKFILEKNNISDIPVYSNSLKFCNGKLTLGYDLYNKKCGRCGHCKKTTLVRHKKNLDRLIYVGDGLSDLCPALKADIVFAKGALLKHCLARKVRCIAYEHLSDILELLSKKSSQAVRLVSANK